MFASDPNENPSFIYDVFLQDDDTDKLNINIPNNLNLDHNNPDVKDPLFKNFNEIHFVPVDNHDYVNNKFLSQMFFF